MFPFTRRFVRNLKTARLKAFTGTVGSEQERLAAERILLAQPEVQRVQNNSSALPSEAINRISRVIENFAENDNLLH